MKKIEKKIEGRVKTNEKIISSEKSNAGIYQKFTCRPRSYKNWSNAMND